MLVYIYDLHLILCIVVGDGNVNFSVVKLLLLMLIQFIRIFPIIVYYAYEEMTQYLLPSTEQTKFIFICRLAGEDFKSEGVDDLH